MSVYLAQVTRPLDQGKNEVVGDVATIKGLEAIFGNIVSVILGFAGIGLFIMLLIGGFNLLTAGSEAPKAEAAKKTITTAILGIVFISLAFLILRIISDITGIDSLIQFKVVSQ